MGGACVVCEGNRRSVGRGSHRQLSSRESNLLEDADACLDQRKEQEGASARAPETIGEVGRPAIGGRLSRGSRECRPARIARDRLRPHREGEERSDEHGREKSDLAIVGAPKSVGGSSCASTSSVELIIVGEAGEPTLEHAA